MISIDPTRTLVPRMHSILFLIIITLRAIVGARGHFDEIKELFKRLDNPWVTIEPIGRTYYYAKEQDRLFVSDSHEYPSVSLVEDIDTGATYFLKHGNVGPHEIYFNVYAY